jgi:hypothetical protein
MIIHIWTHPAYCLRYFARLMLANINQLDSGQVRS